MIETASDKIEAIELHRVIQAEIDKDSTGDYAQRIQDAIRAGLIDSCTKPAIEEDAWFLDITKPGDLKTFESPDKFGKLTTCRVTRITYDLVVNEIQNRTEKVIEDNIVPIN
jgi:hypothetical protein